MDKKKMLLGAIYLSLAASIWGAMFIAVRVAVQVIPPIPLVWMRYLTAIVVLYILGRCTGVSWKIRRNDWKMLFLIGLSGQTISIVTQETGTWLTTAQMGSIITAASPAFMIIFAKLILRERFTIGRAISVALATIGVLLIVVDPENVQLDSYLGGISLIVAALTWALMSVLLKKVPGYSPVVITFYGVVVALVLLLPSSIGWLMNADWNEILRPEISASVLYLGAVSTTGGFVLWNKGLLLMDASVGGLFLFLQPVVGTYLGWLLLGETITSAFWIGSLLIVGGVALAIRGK